MRGVPYILTFLITLLVVGSCDTQSSEEKPIAKSLVNEPDQVMTNSEIFLMNDSRRAAAVKSDLLKPYTRIDTTLLYVVEVRFFDSVGVQTSTLTADSGRVCRQTNMMSVAGHVRAHTNDNRRLVADSLRWDAKNDRVVTEGYVEIYRGDDKLTGYGLETDQRFGKVLIKRNPKGSFNEPGE
jgi:LPS export ABC transporter protein LptC